MQRAQQGNIAQHTRPDHASRLDQPPCTQTSNAVAKQLTAKDNHHAKSGLESKSVVLGRLDDVGRIGRSETK